MRFCSCMAHSTNIPELESFLQYLYQILEVCTWFADMGHIWDKFGTNLGHIWDNL